MRGLKVLDLLSCHFYHVMYSKRVNLSAWEIMRQRSSACKVEKSIWVPAGMLASKLASMCILRSQVISAQQLVNLRLMTCNKTNEAKMLNCQCVHSRHNGQVLCPWCCRCCLHAFWIKSSGEMIHLDCAHVKFSPGQWGDLQREKRKRVASVIPEVVGLPLCYPQSPPTPPSTPPWQ